MKGLSQQGLGEKFGLTEAAIRAWESGKNWPRVEVLLELARVLERSPVEMLALALGEPIDTVAHEAGYRDGLEDAARVAAGSVRLAIESLGSAPTGRKYGTRNAGESTTSPFQPADPSERRAKILSIADEIARMGSSPALLKFKAEMEQFNASPDADLPDLNVVADFIRVLQDRVAEVLHPPEDADAI